MLACLVLLAVSPLCVVTTSQQFERFLEFGVRLLLEDINGGARRTLTKRESPGFYALPLPQLPSDLTGNLAGMKLTNNIDPDLVKLANDIFGSDQVLRPVVNYEAPTNPLPPSLDPFDLTSNYRPEPVGQEGPSPNIPFSIQDILEALDEVNQFPPTDQSYERPYSPSPPLSYPPATHKPPPPPPQTYVIHTPPAHGGNPGDKNKDKDQPPPIHQDTPVIYKPPSVPDTHIIYKPPTIHDTHGIYKPPSNEPHEFVTKKYQTTTKLPTKTKQTKYTTKHPHSIRDKLPSVKPPGNIYKKPNKVTEAPKKPQDYYAVIPYKDITKLFELLNKHVHEPIKHQVPHKNEKKKENKNPFKTKITHFRIPQEKKKKIKHTKKKKGRKKVVEICSKSGTNFFALFTLGTLAVNVMINFMFNLMIMIRTTGGSRYYYF